MARGDVDRAAPRVGDPAPAQAREHRDEVLAGLGGDLRVDLDLAVEAGARGEAPSSPPEGDPAVAGGAEVVHERAGVGDALAAGPVELVEHVVDRLGQDDVRGRDRQAVAQRLDAARGGVHRQHRGAGADAAAGGLGDDVVAHVQRGHPRVLVDDVSQRSRAGRARGGRAGRSRRLRRTGRGGSGASRSGRASPPRRAAARGRSARRRGSRPARASWAGAVDAIT